VAAVFVSSMVVWMWRVGRHAGTVIREHVDAVARARHPVLQGIGIFAVAFLLVAREGLETALFLSAAIMEEGASTAFLVGGLGGLVAALALGILIFVGGRRLDLRVFFSATSVVLLLLATRFAASGVEELAEAGVFSLGCGAEEVLEGVSHALGNPWALGLMAAVPIAGLVWAAVRGGSGPADHAR
jgi:high-affinity iron transporter